MSEKTAIEACINLAAMSPHRFITEEIVPRAWQELADLRAELELADMLVTIQRR